MGNGTIDHRLFVIAIRKSPLLADATRMTGDGTQFRR